MFEVKPRGVEKKGGSTETDDTSSSSKQCGGGGSMGSQGSESLYLYDSQDWVISPICSPEEEPCPTAISPMLAEETFRYMNTSTSQKHSGQIQNPILSADRVEQMTKTYNDIEVVTHLLAERDRDLELAARIGQSLLQRNHLLQERNESVEEQLAQALDQVHQLQHELGKKDELLRMVASASEESETDSSCSTPLHPRQPLAPAVALSQLEALQGKMSDLEEENLALRSEARHLKTETITFEEKEQQLVSDCVKELRESNSQMVNLTEELAHKNEEVMRHQEEISQLLSQIVELQHRVKELALEKEELRIHLQASKDAQRSLTAELNELADRNVECVGMLHESQEEIKELRSKNTPSAGMRRHLPYGLFPMDSLAAEIEGTMRRELSVEDEVAFQDQKVSQKKVFQTVRVVNESVERAAAMATPPIPGSGGSCLVMTAQPFLSAQGIDQSHGRANREEVPLGKPGAPGGNDLVSALHRLSLRRQNFLCERQFFQAERDKKLEALAGGAESDVEGSGYSSPMSSLMSSFTNLSEFSVSSSCFKTFLPEKLQIVKPMEGSLTLHHWQQLAMPHLGTILDPHPGVVTKGFRPLPHDALADTVYRLTDLEEDEEGGDEEQKYDMRGNRGKEGTDAWEKKGEEEEEEEEGITFKVQYSSTPEENRERIRERLPLNGPPVSPVFVPVPGSPQLPLIPITCDLPMTSNAPCDIISVPALLALPVSVTSMAPVQSQSLTVTSLTTTTSSSVYNPGKCQSSTSSTYTFTTCRILHPSDITQVTSSSHCQSSVSEYTPSSMRTGPSTPVTPCRLSLGVDSFPPRRPPAPCGLAKLVLERGISASLSTADAPPPSHLKAPLPQRLLPRTPPNSPSHSPTSSPVPFESRASAPATCDNFLASRPAELFLQDVYGLKFGRTHRPNLPSPDPASHSFSHGPRIKSKAKPDPINVNLVERLRRLGLVKVPQGVEPLSECLVRQDSATFLATGVGSLLDGLRRNQSLPAMIGATRGSPSHHLGQAPPQPPTSLAIAPPLWGNLKGQRSVRSRPASTSTSHAPPPSLKP
ncbi:trafficking kinesin-binding protein 2 isoform X2 [Oncorhynchus kisutch]|uniref:trafficking kinesin-binding protein 2 isoform X2 n=1 Tax=Oncorhynchus kisutch TaxID=8019 RepID=UPI0012DE624F|nr:trafficking kinesin-binding protein 2-like isoform X2 [Oncorhynchus kisutch]